MKYVQKYDKTREQLVGLIETLENAHDAMRLLYKLYIEVSSIGRGVQKEISIELMNELDRYFGFDDSE